MPLIQMETDANFPSDNGISVGPATPENVVFLQRVDLIISGDPGTTPEYTVQVKDSAGNWIDTELTLADVGQVSGIVEGSAVRLVADNGTSPGTGADTPAYHLGVTPLPYTSTGDYTG